MKTNYFSLIHMYISKMNSAKLSYFLTFIMTSMPKSGPFYLNLPYIPFNPLFFFFSFFLFISVMRTVVCDMLSLSLAKKAQLRLNAGQHWIAG